MAVWLLWMPKDIWEKKVFIDRIMGIAQNTITVQLNKLRFFAYHGLYDEELKTGNEFEVSLKITFLTDKGIITHLHDTVNYVQVYNLVKELMQHREQLLETIAMKIAIRINEEFPAVNCVEVTIVKLQPPIINFSGNVAVTYRKEF